MMSISDPWVLLDTPDLLSQGPVAYPQHRSPPADPLIPASSNDPGTLIHRSHNPWVYLTFERRNMSSAATSDTLKEESETVEKATEEKAKDETANGSEGEENDEEEEDDDEEDDEEKGNLSSDFYVHTTGMYIWRDFTSSTGKSCPRAETDKSCLWQYLQKKSLIVEGKREKKKVERLCFESSVVKKEPVLTEGKGKKLYDIERVQYFLKKKKCEELRLLHRLLFNRQGTVNMVKKNIGQFNGFPFEKSSDLYKKKEDMLKKFKKDDLKNICGVLDLEKSGANSELVSRIITFLMEPKSTGKPLPKSKSKPPKGGKKERSSSGSARRSKSRRSNVILTDESSSEEETKDKEESSADDQESEEEVEDEEVQMRIVIGEGVRYAQRSFIHVELGTFVPKIPPGKLAMISYFMTCP
ncbi:unnamed protein product [Ranitomeya imitator]|uniref:SAP domain-containing protein n=1 Tax=Ranitomeya imitator TaxID=111125 RepID=A0ABN9LTS7_9NEOB|nr:unnamed protein product [Ranitomeya imitator]